MSRSSSHIWPQVLSDYAPSEASRPGSAGLRPPRASTSACSEPLQKCWPWGKAAGKDSLHSSAAFLAAGPLCELRPLCLLTHPSPPLLLHRRFRLCAQANNGINRCVSFLRRGDSPASCDWVQCVSGRNILQPRLPNNDRHGLRRHIANYAENAQFLSKAAAPTITGRQHGYNAAGHRPGP